MNGKTSADADEVPPRDRRGIVVKEPIHEQILPHVRGDIVRSRWQPGERLSEPQLCREFGVSRTPLRDALKVRKPRDWCGCTPMSGRW